MSIDQLRHTEFRSRLERLWQVLLQPQPWHNDTSVNRHLRYGIVRRTGMINHAINMLATLPNDGSDVLDPILAEAQNLALNSLVMNTRGCLDNAAWALIHHFPLLESPDEANFQHRRTADLLGTTFLRKLSIPDDELSTRLKAFVDWGRDLKNVRDPSAHRIPLYIPPGIVDEAGLARRHAIDEKIDKAKGSREKATLIRDQYAIARFYAVVTVSDENALSHGSLSLFLNQHMSNLLDILELLVSFVFAGDAQVRSAGLNGWPRRSAVLASERTECERE